METTQNEQRFTDYYQLANRIIQASDKETLAEVARVMAIHVAHYQTKFGKISMEAPRDWCIQQRSPMQKLVRPRMGWNISLLSSR